MRNDLAREFSWLSSFRLGFDSRDKKTAWLIKHQRGKEEESRLCLGTLSMFAFAPTSTCGSETAVAVNSRWKRSRHQTVFLYGGLCAIFLQIGVNERRVYSTLVLCCFMFSLFHARWWSSSSRERIDDTHEVFFGVMYLGCSGHFLSFSLSCLVVVVHNGLAAVVRTAFLVHLPEKRLEHCSARQTHTHKKKTDVFHCWYASSTYMHKRG